MKTLTRNVISLWDEVSTPCQDNTSLFSQSEELLSSGDPKVLRITSIEDSTTKGFRRARCAKKKTQKRLLFDEDENNAKTTRESMSEMLAFDRDFPFNAISNRLNKTYGAASCKRQGFRIKNLFLNTGIKNYTFPLYIPVKTSDVGLSSMIRALNVSVKWNNTISSFEDRNNNSFLRFTDRTDPCTQWKEDTQEFEKDIHFLSTVPNKTSTPIKDDCSKLEPKECPRQQTFVGTYARLAEGLTQIFTSKSDAIPALRYYGTSPTSKEIQYLPPVLSSEDKGFTLSNQESRTPRFASEDEEAVYYLITKYLED